MRRGRDLLTRGRKVKRSVPARTRGPLEHYARRLRPWAWIAKDGTVRLNPLRWPTTTAGLPTRQVELPVRGVGGSSEPSFDADTPISQEQCHVDVALVDQLGAALAHEAN
jgi:hypothetical protein